MTPKPPRASISLYRLHSKVVLFGFTFDLASGISDPEMVAMLEWHQREILATGLVVVDPDMSGIAHQLRTDSGIRYKRPYLSFVPAPGLRRLALKDRIRIAEGLAPIFAIGPAHLNRWEFVDWVANCDPWSSYRRWKFSRRESELAYVAFFTRFCGRPDGMPTRLGNGLREREGLITLLTDHGLLADRYTLRALPAARS